MKLKHCALIALAFATLLLTGCADKVDYRVVTQHEVAGFWLGMWHGMILPFAWFVSRSSRFLAQHGHLRGLQQRRLVQLWLCARLRRARFWLVLCRKIPLMTDQIYDPKDPNWHGYRLLRPDPPVVQFLRAKLLKWYCECCWSLYGRDEVVAWYLHREQTLAGKLKNRLARQVLHYVYGT